MAKKNARRNSESSSNGKPSVARPRAASNSKPKSKTGGKSSPTKPSVEEVREMVAKAKGKGKQVAPPASESSSSVSEEGAAEESTKPAPRRRKKGKVFMEDKASLLHLLDDVTASKNAVISAKLNKEKDRAAAAKALVAKREAGKKGRKADERAKAMEKAKEAILVRDREKKEKMKSKKKGVPVVAAPKRRVGFA